MENKFKPTWRTVRRMESTTNYSGPDAEMNARKELNDPFPDMTVTKEDWTTTLEKWDENVQKWVTLE